MSGEAAVHPAANSVPRAPSVRSQQSFDGMLHAVRTQEQEEAAENTQFMQLQAELRRRKQEAKRLNEERGELLKVREKALAHAQRERGPLPPGLSASGARGLLARKLAIVESSMKLIAEDGWSCPRQDRARSGAHTTQSCSAGERTATARSEAADCP